MTATQIPLLTEWFRHVPEDKWLRDPAQSRADAQAIWDKLGLTAGCRIFECPCNKADLSFPLARKGAVVTGLEFNAHFVAAAKNKFQRAGLPGEFRSDDMRTAEFPVDMDAVINWSSSFGFFSDENNAALVRKFFDSLKSGGTLLIEVANPHRVIAGKATRIIASGEVVDETWDAQTHRASVVFPQTSYRGPVKASVRIYLPEEFEAMLKQAGFASVEFFGQGFAPFNPEGERLIVAARKA